MFCPVKAIGKTVATERRMERDMKYITKNLDFQLDKRSVVTLGKFDGVHKGHSKLINRVLEIGKEGYETVVFTFDVSPLVRLGTRIKRTILTNEERRILLERRGVDCLVECPFVPEIIRMEPEDFIREILVKQLRAAYVVVGPDFHFGHNRKGNPELLRQAGTQYGFEVEILSKETRENARSAAPGSVRYFRKEISRKSMSSLATGILCWEKWYMEDSWGVPGDFRRSIRCRKTENFFHPLVSMHRKLLSKVKRSMESPMWG